MNLPQGNDRLSHAHVSAAAIVIYSLWCAILYARNLPIPFGDFQFFHEPILTYLASGVPTAPGLSCLHPDFIRSFNVYPPGLLYALAPIYALFDDPLHGFQLASYLTALLTLLAMSSLFAAWSGVQKPNPTQLALHAIVLGCTMIAHLVPVTIHPQNLALPVAILAAALSIRPSQMSIIAPSILLSLACITAPFPAIVVGFIIWARLLLTKDMASATALAITTSLLTICLFTTWFIYFPGTYSGFLEHLLNHIAIADHDTSLAGQRYAVRSNILATLHDSLSLIVYLSAAFLAAYLVSTDNLKRHLVTVAAAISLLAVLGTGGIDRLFILVPLLLVLGATDITANTPRWKTALFVMLVVLSAWPQTKAGLTQLLADSGQRYIDVKEELSHLSIRQPVRADTVYWLMLKETGINAQNLGYCPVTPLDAEVQTVITERRAPHVLPGWTPLPLPSLTWPFTDAFRFNWIFTTGAPWDVVPILFIRP